ncbi:hypothetical protein [Williamsia serinedens]|uniref:Uncharacterized protein n=1 Tax=Williamsia serinedens TaxID=391736 RepID=A0ABT1H770_9NOCA|nr:hypothetical protein [Williamsia serinedens]MCP2163100.1 hypothetical protein [Williamsia serinedens]
MRLRDIGKPWFSWADLKAIVMRAFSDPMSELHRKLNPDWRLQTPEVRLLSEIATIQSSSRYWQVAKILNGQDVPQTYWETRYGLPAEEVDEVDNAAESADAAARARAVANEIMAG